jgi:hypothetical protein
MKKFDRDYLFHLAKQRMLKRGEHQPFVVAEDQPHCLPVLDEQGWATDALGRKKTLFVLGRTFAQEECITSEMIDTLFFVQEMWFVSRSSDDTPVKQPSQEPDRRECLGVLELRTAGGTVQQTFCVSEIIRHGGIIDLGPKRETGEPQSGLLSSFLAGMISAQWNDDEFAQRLDRLQNVGEF